MEHDVPVAVRDQTGPLPRDLDPGEPQGPVRPEAVEVEADADAHGTKLNSEAAIRFKVG